MKRQANFAVLALLLIFVAGCASSPPAATSEDVRAKYLRELETSAALYNITVDAAEMAVDTGLVTPAQKANIDPYGEATNALLLAAYDTLAGWDGVSSASAVEEAAKALGKALKELTAAWQEVKP